MWSCREEGQAFRRQRAWIEGPTAAVFAWGVKEEGVRAGVNLELREDPNAGHTHRRRVVEGWELRLRRSIYALAERAGVGWDLPRRCAAIRS